MTEKDDRQKVCKLAGRGRRCGRGPRGQHATSECLCCSGGVRACGRAALSSFEGGWVRTAQVSLPPHSDALIPGEGHKEGVKRWLEGAGT